MNEQFEALRLADELDGLPADDFFEALGDEASAELRRLHELNAELLAALGRIANWNEHTLEFAADCGSIGVRDFYRSIALKAITKAQ